MPGGNASGALTSAADGDVVVDGDDGALRLPGADNARIWAWATAGFALLWLVTLVWALQRRPQAAPQRDGRAEPSKAGTGLRDLKRVLDRGDFGEVAEVPFALADPPAADLDTIDRKRVVWVTRMPERVDLGGRRTITK